MTRFVVPLNRLPITSASAQHIVRFRVISEDRNRISDWSPIFLFDSVGQTPSASVTYKLTETGSAPKLLTLVWTGDYVTYNKQLDANHQHDVFVSWSLGPYEYLGRQSGNGFSIPAKQGASKAQFYVQMPSYNSLHPPTQDPVISEKLKIFETTILNI